jgi:hypothetical protein
MGESSVSMGEFKKRNNLLKMKEIIFTKLKKNTPRLRSFVNLADVNFRKDVFEKNLLPIQIFLFHDVGSARFYLVLPNEW